MTGSTLQPFTPAARPRRTTMARALAALTLAVVPFGLAACGDDEESTSSGASGSTPAETASIVKNDANSGITVTLGSKNFTEQQVLGEVYAQSLEAAGYTVKRDFGQGDEKAALKALEEKEIDAYPEYTGTALGSFFEVPGDEIPKDPTEAYNLVRTNFEKEGISALPATPFTSSNEVAVTKETADRDGLTKISDLSKVADTFTLYGSPECRSRIDCLKGLEDVYGLKFEKFTPVDIALRHEVLTSGKADVSIVFTTDPQIAREGFVLLEDDKKMFPPYNSTLLVRQDVLEKAGPDFEKTIALVNSKLDNEVIQELNAKKDLDKQSAADAATSYLTEFGFVK
ncbi:MAG: hypothetical protein JHD16_06455 [Solirubrobacteraceae bacterium]|nr:hypothetical protein [Solirubrobacteraceae bacterium]